MRSDTPFWIGSALAIVAAYVLTLVIKNEYIFFAGYVVLQFVVLATAWNILGGYAGYVNFGTAAFVGLGTYVAVAVGKAFGLPLPVQVLLAAACGAALGFATGLLTLRLRGIFYSIATVALTIIVETFIINWKFVGGAAGIQLLRPPVTPPFTSYIQMMFVLGMVMVVIAIAVARYIERGWIGRGLRAIRDDELAAECSGVPTLRLKLIACAISGALMCAAGAPNPMYFQFAIPSAAFDLNYSVAPLAMSLIGGTAHWLGPVLGALLLAITQQVLTVTISSELNILVLGIMLVLFVVAAPEGIIGLLRKIGLFKTKAVRPSGGPES
jgi:branched-chain amino acid transport system permease protein